MSEIRKNGKKSEKNGKKSEKMEKIRKKNGKKNGFFIIYTVCVRRFCCAIASAC